MPKNRSVLPSLVLAPEYARLTDLTTGYSRLYSS
jgi:hypothetical protein